MSAASISSSTMACYDEIGSRVGASRVAGLNQNLLKQQTPTHMANIIPIVAM